MFNFYLPEIFNLTFKKTVYINLYDSRDFDSYYIYKSREGLDTLARLISVSGEMAHLKEP